MRVQLLLLFLRFSSSTNTDATSHVAAAYQSLSISGFTHFYSRHCSAHLVVSFLFCAVYVYILTFTKNVASCVCQSQPCIFFLSSRVCDTSQDSHAAIRQFSFFPFPISLCMTLCLGVCQCLCLSVYPSLFLSLCHTLVAHLFLWSLLVSVLDVLVANHVFLPGVSHMVVTDDFGGICAIMQWLAFVPKVNTVHIWIDNSTSLMYGWLSYNFHCICFKATRRTRNTSCKSILQLAYDYYVQPEEML